jgi:hypothetical protein
MDWLISQGKDVGVDVSVGTGVGLGATVSVRLGVFIGVSRGGIAVREDVVVGTALLRVTEIVDRFGLEISGVVA